MIQPENQATPSFPSLAEHLRRAARESPQALALIYGERRYAFAEWLHAVSITPGRDNGPLMVAGDAWTLARSAYQASLQNRPFWPVDRKSSPAATQPVPPDVALVISTSGSEGSPRAVLLGHRQLDVAAANANTCLSLGPGDLWLNCLPLYHIGGLSIFWRCTRAGAGVLLHDGFDTALIAQDFARWPVSHISLVPAMLARLLDAHIPPPASLRVALIGGAALSQVLYDRAIAAGWPLYPSYGMSETAAQIATFVPGDGQWQAGRVGHPMPGHELRIAADGRIQIRGPQVMLGTLDGRGIDGEGWLSTGDLGEIDHHGRLTVIGRADDLLISAGRNIHPAEIESCLSACPGVGDIAVTGLPDPVWGDLIVALVVGTASREALQAHARAHLPSAAQPRRIRHLDTLPRNPAGKLERATLRRLALEAT